jgi:glycosyltransferase involved in cell wall biosynthesis
MNEVKKTSVVIPNYNYKKYLKGRIRSILRQSYPIYELIILDDASTDGSVEEILRVLKKYKIELKEDKTQNSRGEKNYNFENENFKVKLVVNEKNSGKAILQWKKGFELATGDYVWIAEADDLSSRNFLREVMNGFCDPEVVLSYTESEIINKWGIMICPNFRWSRDREKTGHYDESYTKDGVREIEEIMAIRCTIPNVSAVVFYKNEKIPFGRYLDEAVKFGQVGDWYFYAKILDHGRISYNRKSLNKFRVHEGSKTATAKKEKSHYEEILRMHKMFTTEYKLDKSMKEKMLEEEKRILKRISE